MLLVNSASTVQLNWLYFILSVFIISVAFLFIGRAGVPVFPIDDSYITLHNAQVVWWGHDPNYVGNPALTGATSAVHLALVAGLMSVLSPLRAMEASAWLAVLLYAIGLARLAFIHKASIFMTILLVSAGLLIARTPHHLMNGLETGLALAGLTWAIVFSTDQLKARSPHLPILCGILPFIRPELAAVSLLLMLFRFNNYRLEGWSRITARAVAFDLLYVFLAVIPWITWYWINTGVPYPMTISAKRAFFAESGLPFAVKFRFVFDSFRGFIAEIGLISIGFIALLKTATGRIGLLFCAIFLIVYLMQFPGALTHYNYRYLYVLLPFLFYGIISLAPLKESSARFLIFGLLIVGLVQSGIAFPARWKDHETSNRFTVAKLAGVADWCNNHLPENAVILIHDAGYISYATRFRLIDLVGLKTSSNIIYHKNLTQPSGGMLRPDAINQIALKNKPDFLIVLTGWDNIFKISNSLRSKGWKLHLLYPRSSMKRSRSYAGYKVFSLASPNDSK